MKFRVARHTNDLEPIIRFYTELVGLEVLGSFEKHDKYGGVFLGVRSENWHLEFTVSDDPADHKPDDDDLLVFYTTSMENYNQIITRFSQQNMDSVAPKNPYWGIHGSTFPDPDGFKIVIVKPQN